MKRNLIFTAGVMLALVFSLAGCQKKQAETETTAPAQVITETEAQTSAQTESTENLPEGQMRSYLTGEIISKNVGLQRPYAIMINNIVDALPQSGISNAEMIYEAKVEGGITRLMAVFQDVDKVKKIGSIRSARHYYIDFANDNNAIYVHFGQSKYAKARIEKEKIKTISGLSSYGGEVFYRSKDRVAPHNVYTSGELLKKGLKATGITRDYPQGYTARLQFNTTDTQLAGGFEALQVNIPFDCKPYFVYDEKTGLYKRFEFGKKHIDVENNKQLTFKNIIVQYVKEKTISKKNHQDLKLTGSGKGYYITDGKAINITWQRKTEADRTLYYDESGAEIKLNTGKTFFEVVPKNSEVTFGKNGTVPGSSSETAKTPATDAE